MFKNIEDTDYTSEFSISGLKFEANQSLNIPCGASLFNHKLISSAGPMISDFVTHEANFNYSTYGIHVGQDDRLTFMGGDRRRIEGYFVDCREESPTLHQIVRLRFNTSLKRHLVIPSGVAHTFDNLEHVVTRDEPVWYSDTNNSAWSIDNDLVSVSRDTRLEDFPVVRPNKLRLPNEAHTFLSKISQSLLENPKAYLARFAVSIAGTETYVMLEPKQWSDDEGYLAELISNVTSPGVIAKRNRYALTGQQSFTLVPNTDSCVADVLILKENASSIARRYWHARTRKIYTFLNNEGSVIEIDCIDLRKNSPTYGKEYTSQVICDPRISLWIDQGIAYFFRCAEDMIIRCEHEVFVDINEPRGDLPMFGQDMISLPNNEAYPNLSLPVLKCPGEVVYKMAQFEQQQFNRI
ncbi:dTDP-4-dehydrorhamnose 3,5-epimerase family protein [Pseudomonas fluorescens]|uniref:dTDP-4-dehydrorhamnose 3,5-epimerase n=1 Tax=Pseudomonas fluorescens TaxID=294 RepID=A0A5E7S1G2_PSEFL|nr:dTDP-4-dehydrorhamnose 3,5-epimerase family protein [Pseudomonas fluorescens]VVP79728.1 hypothetical protein PS941_00669 [Pseudomonas fluorescens]